MLVGRSGSRVSLLTATAATLPEAARVPWGVSPLS